MILFVLKTYYNCSWNTNHPLEIVGIVFSSVGIWKISTNHNEIIEM